MTLLAPEPTTPWKLNTEGDCHGGGGTATYIFSGTKDNSGSIGVSIGPLKWPAWLRAGLHKNFCLQNVAHFGLALICEWHYDDVIMSAMASQITNFTVVYSTFYSGTHQSSASLAFVWGIHRGPVNSPHKWPVTWKMFPFDDVIMVTLQ